MKNLVALLFIQRRYQAIVGSSANPEGYIRVSEPDGRGGALEW